ncbi:cytochrome P450 9e2 isoform X1 [Cryptotermes secundus]|uniref:cytochrome P450 9e2 isoform X1 n=1 Tax=Cryptotermes secundus TaxID=105785 RepID=UPI000CD7BA57|nr:cytochrome P450 9e2 isoform X1 [Cryptotermes secundus]
MRSGLTHVGEPKVFPAHKMAILDWTWLCLVWTLLVLAAGVVLYFWGTSTYGRFTKQNIPHLKPLPFIGSMAPYMGKKSLFEHLLESYNQFKGHQFGIMFMFRRPVVYVRDLELIKTIAVKDFEYFTDHQTDFFESGESIWSKLLFILKGQRWRDMRATVSPAFTSSKMKTMFVLVNECSEQLLDFLEQSYQQPLETGYKIKRDGDLLVLEVKELYARYTNDVIATTAFGLKVDSLKHPTNEFYMMGQDATSFGAIKWLIFLSIPKVMKFLGINLIPGKITQFFKTLVLDTVATREREGIIRPDLLHLLIQAKKGTLHEEDSAEGQKGAKINDEDIIAQSLQFFLAGFDTSSTLMSFVSYLLAIHPDVQTRLQEEIDKTLKKHDGKFTYEMVHSMKYLDMVVSETLRLYPPAAAVGRVCVKNYTLKSDPPLELRPGDDIMIPVYGLQHDPNYFPDPERFDPERFSDDNKHNINPMTYIPFGLGPRSCIGNRFALMETKSLLAHLLSRFSVKVISKTPIPIKVIQKGFNVTAEGGFWLGLEKRIT